MLVTTNIKNQSLFFKIYNDSSDILKKKSIIFFLLHNTKMLLFVIYFTNFYIKQM